MQPKDATRWLLFWRIANLELEAARPRVTLDIVVELCLVISDENIGYALSGRCASQQLNAPASFHDVEKSSLVYGLTDSGKDAVVSQDIALPERLMVTGE